MENSIHKKKKNSLSENWFKSSSHKVVGPNPFITSSLVTFNQLPEPNEKGSGSGYSINLKKC